MKSAAVITVLCLTIKTAADRYFTVINIKISVFQPQITADGENTSADVDVLVLYKVTLDCQRVAVEVDRSVNL